MRAEFLYNTQGVTLVLAPESPLEEELCKKLATQSNNVAQLDSAIGAGTKAIRNGLVISQVSNPGPLGHGGGDEDKG